MALTAICDEAHDIDITARNKILPRLLLFGRDLSNRRNPSSPFPPTNGSYDGNDNDTIMNNDVNNSNSDEEDDDGFGRLDIASAERRDRELLRRMGGLIVTLQLTSNLARRCRELLKNAVLQLGGCAVFHHPLQSGGDGNGGSNDNNGRGGDNVMADGWQTSRGVFGEGTVIIPLGEAIAKILGVLVTLDAAVKSNAELVEAWDLYKSVAADALGEGRHDIDGDKGNNGNQLQHWEKMLVLGKMITSLDLRVFSSRFLLDAVDQNFDPEGRFHSGPGPGDDDGNNGTNDGLHGNTANVNDRNDVNDNSDSNDERSLLQSLTFNRSRNRNRRRKRNQQPLTSWRDNITLHGEVGSIISSLLRRLKDGNCGAGRGGITSHGYSSVSAVPGICATYVLYRRLLPPHVPPEQRLYQSLTNIVASMSSSSYAIAVFPLLGGSLAFRPSSFVQQYAPLKEGEGGSNSIGAGKGVQLRGRDIGIGRIHVGGKNSSGEYYDKDHNASFSSSSSPSSNTKVFKRKAVFLFTEASNWLISATKFFSACGIRNSGLGSGWDGNSSTSPSMRIIESLTVTILNGVRIAGGCRSLLLGFLLAGGGSISRENSDNTDGHRDCREDPEFLDAVGKLCSFTKSIENLLCSKRAGAVAEIQRAAVRLVAHYTYRKFDTIR